MDYHIHYNILITRAKDRKLDEYCERHHIVPKCIGGSDDIINMVVLTAREHYVAHQLLVKMHPDNAKLVYAAKMMSMNVGGLRPNNRLYSWLREAHAKKMSEEFSGKKRGFSTEGSFKSGHVPWNKGKVGVQKSTRKGKTEVELYGKERAADLKCKRQKRMRGQTAWNKGKSGRFKWVTDGNENIKIRISDLLPDGFYYGRSTPWMGKA